MTLTNKEVAKVLFKAYRYKKPIDFISENYQLNEEEAYHVQEELIDQLTFKDRSTVTGYKVSMNDGASVSLSELFSPLLEPEIIFIVQEDLPYDADLETIRYHTRIAPGIEIPDARYKNWFPNFTLSDLISDNTATGLVVVGDSVDSLDNDAFANVHLNLYKDDKCIATGESSEVLGNPLNAIHWLIKKLHTHGKQLKKGDIISSGTFISPLKLEYGTYRAEYSGIGKVSFSVNK
ncbi:MAG: 2-keto-4-pentenoate hydratase [Staphylococcus epidermidis]|nr:2-keto-4-pentenoate hydratase [Staphylococcus epidermidis]